MAKTKVLFFMDDRGECPFVEWIHTLPPKPRDKVTGYIERLKLFGSELRRPVADSLRDGIHELRPSYIGIQYRVLYFFHGQDVVVVSHGIEKEARVPDREIDLAIRHRGQFRQDPARHTCQRPDLW